jgi:hypothetical protein
MCDVGGNGTTDGRVRTLSAYAARQCDITRATGIYLESLCREHGVYKQRARATTNSAPER